MWQKTTAPSLSNIIVVSDQNGTPLGGFQIVGEHSSGKTYKSPESSWGYDSSSGYGGYIKLGNVKFEPGGYEDGTWSLYVIDGGGTQVSDKVPLTYSSSKDQWVWDFIWWSE